MPCGLKLMTLSDSIHVVRPKQFHEMTINDDVQLSEIRFLSGHISRPYDKN